jgi:dienelactone hydrolase
MNVVNGFLMVTVLFAALWWAFARGHFPRALAVLSLVSLGLAGVTLVLEGPHWQLVPWQVLAVACAAAATLRWWRPGHSRRWNRVLGRVGLLAGLIVGGVGLLFVSVPVLPRPSGQHLVGSEVFRWTDPGRAETFTDDPGDRREVVAQAWYPTETAGPPVPYFEAQGRLPAYVDPYPAFFYGDFDQVDTHASASPPVSAERPTWPVLLFLPGWGSPREAYSGLSADLASHGYVVVALSHPYESAVSVLADGRVVGAAVGASALGANMADMTPIRAADSRFVLDQLERLAQVEPGSPLVGHLDVRHTGVVGHSMGGAAAAQVVAEDPRFLVGVNLDGTLPAALVGGWHLSSPFLWLQGDGQQQSSYVQVRDELMGGLQRGGEVLVVGGSVHQSFTDTQSYFSAIGRGTLGDGAKPEAVDDITWETSEVIAAFVGQYLGLPGEQTLDEVLAHRPSIKQEQHIAAVLPS